MANLSSQLLDAEGSPPVVGDDFDCTRTVTDVPDGDHLSDAWLTIKTYLVYVGTNSDADATVTKQISSLAVSGQGQITDTGAGDTSASVLFQLTKADTTLLIGGSLYYFGIKVKTAGGKYKTVEQGVFIPAKAVVRAI